MKASALLLTVTIAVIVTVAALPISDPEVQDIVATAILPCRETNTTAQTFLQNNTESILLQILHDQMLETIDELNTTIVLAKQWVNDLPAEVKDTICATLRFHVPQVNNVELNAEQNSRLQALLQMLNFFHFLKSQDDSATYPTNVISRLRRDINNIAITLDELLPMVTCGTIRVYINDDVNGYLVTLQGVNLATKRIASYCVLESMLQTLQALF